MVHEFSFLWKNPSAVTVWSADGSLDHSGITVFTNIDIVSQNLPKIDCWKCCKVIFEVDTLYRFRLALKHFSAHLSANLCISSCSWIVNPMHYLDTFMFHLFYCLRSNDNSKLAHECVQVITKVDIFEGLPKFTASWVPSPSCWKLAQLFVQLNMIGTCHLIFPSYIRIISFVDLFNKKKKNEHRERCEFSQ